MDDDLPEDLTVSFEEVEDPRIVGRVTFPLAEIIFLAIVGAFLDVQSWRGLELFGNERLEFLRRFFPYKNGVPSHKTIGRVFSLIKPTSFEQFFMAWAAEFAGSNAGRQLAIDGKTVRRSFDTASGKQALHLLNVCAVEQGLCLAQLEVGEKTNETTVVPEMIGTLDIKGAMVSVDALNTQKAIAEKIIKAGADYTLALKGNHPSLNDEMPFVFHADVPCREETEKEHGRLTTRKYSLLLSSEQQRELTKDWLGLKAFGRVQTWTTRQNRETFEERFYLLSYDNLDRFAKAARGHWAVENKLHWTLDVTFGEDASRKRKDHAPRNYSLVRKFALNIARRVKGKLSIPLLRIKAAANPDFFAFLIEAAGIRLMDQPSA